jgi:hypothetical protein
MMRFAFAAPVASRPQPGTRSLKEDDMAKGQQRSNREKKKPKQDKKKLAPAPSPLASDQRAKPGWGGKKK